MVSIAILIDRFWFFPGGLEYGVCAFAKWANSAVVHHVGG